MTDEYGFLDKSRTQWGRVFSDFRQACEYVNAARYHVNDKESLKQEDIRRLRAIIGYAQKEIDNWEQNGSCQCEVQHEQEN